MPTMYSRSSFRLPFVSMEHRHFLGVIHVINVTDVTYFSYIFQNKMNCNLVVLIFAHSVYQEKIQLPQVQISNISPTQYLHHVVRLYILKVSQSAELIPCKQTTKGPCAVPVSPQHMTPICSCTCTRVPLRQIGGPNHGVPP